MPSFFRNWFLVYRRLINDRDQAHQRIPKAIHRKTTVSQTMIESKNLTTKELVYPEKIAVNSTDKCLNHAWAREGVLPPSTNNFFLKFKKITLLILYDFRGPQNQPPQPFWGPNDQPP